MDSISARWAIHLATTHSAETRRHFRQSGTHLRNRVVGTARTDREFAGPVKKRAKHHCQPVLPYLVGLVNPLGIALGALSADGVSDNPYTPTGGDTMRSRRCSSGRRTVRADTKMLPCVVRVYVGPSLPELPGDK